MITMKFLSFLLLGQAAIAAASCANNCARAVAGTARKDPPLEVRSSQCVSFLAVTVTPATSTTTTYTTITPVTNTVTTVDATETQITTFTTITQVSSTLSVSSRTVTTDTSYTRPIAIPPREVEARQVTVSPSAVPAYATSCDDAAAYGAACSCGFSLTASTSTAPTPVSTSTITITETASATEHQTATTVESVAITTQTTTTEVQTVDVTATVTLPCPAPSVIGDNGASCTNLRRSCPEWSGPDCQAITVGCGTNCYCSKTDEGFFCSPDGPCSPSCVKNSDCGATQICDIKNCCGHGVCTDITSCANGSLAASIFRSGGKTGKTRHGG